MYKQLVELHEDYYKLWSSAEMKSRYGYVLSPSTFKLTPHMHQQLQDIGLLVADYQNGLRALQKHVSETNLTKDAFVRKIFKDALAGLPLVPSERNVPVCKVDVMIGQNDQLFIAEIDGYNPRGLCYAAFLQDIQKQIGTKEIFFEGVMPTIVKYLEDVDSDTLEWVHANRERYYQPIFHIFSKIMKDEYGINIPVGNLNDSNFEVNGRPSIIIPWGTSYSCERTNRDVLVEKYKNDPEKFFFPLTPWMSTKAIFAILADPNSNNQFAEYNEFFKNENYRKYLPATTFVGKKMDVDCFHSQYPDALLKEHVSSGMKGVVLGGSDNFDAIFQQASKMKNSQWTLQERIEQKVFSIPTFQENGKLVDVDEYIRICAYVDADGTVVDAEVTGRPEPDVHGAPDCVMIPCVL